MDEPEDPKPPTEGGPPSDPRAEAPGNDDAQAAPPASDEPAAPADPEPPAFSANEENRVESNDSEPAPPEEEQAALPPETVEDVAAVEEAPQEASAPEEVPMAAAEEIFEPAVEPPPFPEAQTPEEEEIPVAAAEEILEPEAEPAPEPELTPEATNAPEEPEELPVAAAEEAEPAAVNPPSEPETFDPIAAFKPEAAPPEPEPVIEQAAFETPETPEEPVDAALFIADEPESPAPSAGADNALFVESPPEPEPEIVEPAVEDAAAAFTPAPSQPEEPPEEEIAEPEQIAAIEAAPAIETIAAAESAPPEQPPLPAGPSPLQKAFAGIAAWYAGLTAWAKVFFARQQLGPPVGPWKWPRLKTPSPRRMVIMAGWMTVGMAVIVCGFFVYLTKDMPSTRALWEADNSPSLTFVDRNGRVIIREGAESAPPVDLARLPPYVTQAVIAIEDRRFYDHFGIDVGGLMRAAASNMKAGHVVQGGSTITQQLAKNLFLSNNRTFRRKAQEVALALWLESQFSKSEILALYMSRVYFGAGAYGIEAASERYFDKPARSLTLAEAALLAGLVKAPSKLNPAAQDTAAKARAKVVLDEMLAGKFITASAHDAALRAPLHISRGNPNGNLGYFRDWIDPQLLRVLGDQRDDFIIETTLDLEAQRAGEASLEEVVSRERKAHNVSQGALLAMDSTGGVTAMVGGLDYGKGEGQSEFNRTTQSLRAPGSSFKYFIYLTAMMKGYNPWMIRVDQPVVIGDWAPGNYEEKYYGPVSLISAYAKSLNMVAIQLANEVGGASVIQTAQSLGVGKRLEDYRSLGLGAQGMTVMEMVTGYGAMASGGYPIEPHGIERVRRANGQVLWARRPEKPPVQVIDDRTMKMMNLLGTTVVRAGTGTRAQIPGRMIAGKTGTSNDYRDAWFIGYVPGMVAGVWLGNDNNTSMNKVTGGLLSTEVWKGFMTTALRNTPIQDLELPSAEDMPPPPPIAPAPLEMIEEGGPPATAVVAPPVTALGGPRPGQRPTPAPAPRPGDG